MKQKIPFFSLNRQWNAIKDQLVPSLYNLLESNQFIGGPHVTEFEKQFAKYTTATHAISCNSGTDALWLALKALDIQPHSIVLTTPLSFIASSSEIIAHNAYPLFIDIDESYNISPKKIEDWLKSNAIMRNNKAFHKVTDCLIAGIIPVDLFGQCVDHTKIKAIAQEWNLWIIDDASQAIGAHLNNEKIGTFGDITCISCYPTKNLGAYGDGGVLTTNNKRLAQKLQKLRNHGRKSHYNYECYGINSRLDAIQALVLTQKLGLLDKANTRRREIASMYNKRLANMPFIKTPQETTGYHVYHQYAILIEDANKVITRDTLKQHLETNGIGTNIYYPKALYNIPYLKPHEVLKTDCPNTDHAIQNILALPIWPELTNEEVNTICSCIEELSNKVTSSPTQSHPGL